MREITEDQKRRAAAVLGENLFATWIGMELVDMAPDVAVIRMNMRDDLRQPHGLLHGLEPGERASTADLNVYYLRPHREGPVVCTARVVKAGKRLFTVSGEVANEEGKLIATALSTYSKVG
jgi:acyl-coenzyme A thioesterase PaaI-like protein